MSEAPDPEHQSRRISASQVRLAMSHPFFAALMMMAPREITQAVDTAATDGRRLLFNAGFLAGLAADQLDGLVVHEVLHCALLHVPRRGRRDPLLWNVAADIHVNGLIRREPRLQLPEGAVIDERLEDLSVEEIYEVLRAELIPRALPFPDLRDGGASEGREGPRSSDSGLEPYWKSAIQRALASSALSGRGSVPANLIRAVRDACEPRLDWRTMLWRWMVRTPDDFQGFDRRFLWNRTYLEQLEGEAVHVEVCVDTSGSISEQWLDSFLGEIRGIVRSYPTVRCRLWYADAACHGPFDIDSIDRFPVPVGGGGTDFRPFFERATDGRPMGDGTGAPPLHVYLTDGAGTFPERAPGAPVLWVVPPGGIPSTRFPFGEVARMD
jgi:predicted metal-dependent peptidase